jgi:hypothetical protein
MNAPMRFCSPQSNKTKGGILTALSQTLEESSCLVPLLLNPTAGWRCPQRRCTVGPFFSSPRRIQLKFDVQKDVKANPFSEVH